MFCWHIKQGLREFEKEIEQEQKQGRERHKEDQKVYTSNNILKGMLLLHKSGGIPTFL